MGTFWKALKVLGEWLARFLYLALFLVTAAPQIANSSDPMRTAIFELVFAAAMLAIIILLGLASQFFKARLSERAFRALRRATIGTVIALGGLTWLMMTTFDSWPQMVAAFRSGDAARILLVRAEPLLRPLAAVAAMGGVFWLVETLLRGDIRLAARIALGALVAFWVVVFLPASLEHRQVGQPLFDRSMILALVLWLGMVIPALGVFIAYRRIGDGRT